MNDQAQAAYLATQFLTEAALAERWCLNIRGLRAKQFANPEAVPTFLKLSKSGIRYPIEAVIALENELLEKSRS